MVVMQTWLTGSIVFVVRCWTLYSSVNLRPSSGRGVLLELAQRLPAQVGAVDQEEDAPRAGVLDQPVEGVTAVKVLPLPVAIWIRARGRSSASECSRLRIASICAGHRPSVMQRRQRAQAGAQASSALRPRPAASRAGGSEDAAAARLGVEPVGEEGLDAGALVEERQRLAPGRAAASGRPALYFSDCASTPLSVSPACLASTTPTALRSTKSR